MIGIAGSVFLTIGGGWIAAVLFSIGLIIICARGYNLYTGKIGYIRESKDLLKMLVYLIGNFIGVFLVSLTVVGAPAATLVATKLAIPYWLLALKSIGCGFLMYLAVDIYKTRNSFIGIVTCIPAFILAGFEHSIADMFYICCSGILNWQLVPFLVIVILGNAIGALLHRFIK